MPAAALDPAQQALLDETRELVDELATRAGALGVPAATRSALAASREQLEHPFMLVVVGEWNAGKSALVNALLGERVLEEGVTPTTTRVSLLRHGKRPASATRPDGVVETVAPVELLRTLSVVDTPGTNAVLREHEALTREFLPRADLVLFVTSADRPFSESERAFLEAIREWGKKVVLVLNKRDLLRSEADLATVTAFVREQAAATLGLAPVVWALAARDGLEARLAQDAKALEASGLPAFEAQLWATLDEKERFRLKLQNPLGVARRAAGEAGTLVAQRLALLQGDLQALAEVEQRLAGNAGELERDFRFRLADVEKTLYEFERRGQAFFDERLRLGRFRQLFDRERLRRDFEAEAVAGLPREVERQVEGVVDFLVDAELRQWQEVTTLLAERRAAQPGAAAGVDDRFSLDRARLLERVREAAQAAVEHYDAPAEARRLAEKVREAVAQTALLQVSALGLGALVAALASTTAADVTGILAAGALSLFGLVLLPARREKARRELAGKVAQVREKLMAALGSSFEAERARALAHVREAVRPYTSFVHREREELEQAKSDLAALAARLADLDGRVTNAPGLTR